MVPITSSKTCEVFNCFPSLITSPPMSRCIPQLSELADALAISLPPAVEPLQSLLSVLLRPDAPAVSSAPASGGSPAAVGDAFPGGSHTDRSVAAAAGWHGAAGAPDSYDEASSEDKGNLSDVSDDDGGSSFCDGPGLEPGDGGEADASYDHAWDSAMDTPAALKGVTGVHSPPERPQSDTAGKHHAIAAYLPAALPASARRNNDSFTCAARDGMPR